MAKRSVNGGRRSVHFFLKKMNTPPSPVHAFLFRKEHRRNFALFYPEMQINNGRIAPMSGSALRVFCCAQKQTRGKVAGKGLLDAATKKGCWGSSTGHISEKGVFLYENFKCFRKEGGEAS